MCSRGMLRCSKMLSERDAVDDKTLVPHVSRAATKASPGVCCSSPSITTKGFVTVLVFVRKMGVGGADLQGVHSWAGWMGRGARGRPWRRPDGSAPG